MISLPEIAPSEREKLSGESSVGGQPGHKTWSPQGGREDRNGGVLFLPWAGSEELCGERAVDPGHYKPALLAKW